MVNHCSAPQTLGCEIPPMLKKLYLPHSAPRDFIMVSTPDLAQALGTTKPEPFHQTTLVWWVDINLDLIGIMGCYGQEDSAALCFYHSLSHIQCQEGCAL